VARGPLSLAVFAAGAYRLFRELVFVTRHRELPSGRHVEAGQEEFLSLYTSLLDMAAAD